MCISHAQFMPILTENLTVHRKNYLDKNFHKASDEEICCTQLLPISKRFLFKIWCTDICSVCLGMFCDNIIDSIDFGVKWVYVLVIMAIGGRQIFEGGRGGQRSVNFMPKFPILPAQNLPEWNGCLASLGSCSPLPPAFYSYAGDGRGKGYLNTDSTG